MDFKLQSLNKRKQNEEFVYGLIENRKKRLLETFSELTLNDGIHKQEVDQDKDMKYMSFYEKDAHTTVIENIENFTNNEEEDKNIESSVCVIKGIKEKFINIPEYILKSKKPIMDLVLYQSPKYPIYEDYLKERNYINQKIPVENKSIYNKKMNKDISMNIDVMD
ncbi:hypothetical protein PCANB_001492 [Pneumocystis canis]|nr:hypothetical protein PCANB_001492 [Pneumocystis canis]